MAVDSALRLAVLFAWGHKCFYCGRHAAHIDHVTPKCKQGSDVPGNLVACCEECNRMKWSLWPPVEVLKEALVAAKIRAPFVLQAAGVFREAEKFALDRINYGSLPLREGTPPLALVKRGERKMMAARDLARICRSIADSFEVLQAECEKQPNRWAPSQFR